MIDRGLLYGACRERVIDLVAHLTPDQAAARVLACPDWTVHDTIAHMVGIVTDVNAGNLDGVGQDHWTAAQVETRKDASMAELIAEWETGSPQLEDGLRAVGGIPALVAVADVWNHEQDIRGALGTPGSHDPAAELAALEGYIAVRAALFDGLAPLRFVAGNHTFQSGDGEPGATVISEPFELARMICGRRTADQIRAYRWDGDAEPYLTRLADLCPAQPLPC
ncbi:MAG: maleylpyruvate isomerase family mycothiol-dependent enzyme [Actinobacteria bacterium]|nr:maleylpyruvate isomerase family mycothiol-dependent enzyme [Actinomycetota bacterium]